MLIQAQYTIEGMRRGEGGGKRVMNADWHIEVMTIIGRQAFGGEVSFSAEDGDGDGRWRD